MFRPNLLQFNAMNTLLTIVIFIILGVLSSCSKWMPAEYRDRFNLDRVHFGELSRKRHISRSRKKHSPSYGKYDTPQVTGPHKDIVIDVGIALDDHKNTIFEPDGLDTNYTFAGK